MDIDIDCNIVEIDASSSVVCVSLKDITKSDFLNYLTEFDADDIINNFEDNAALLDEMGPKEIVDNICKNELLGEIGEQAAMNYHGLTRDVGEDSTLDDFDVHDVLAYYDESDLLDGIGLDAVMKHFGLTNSSGSVIDLG